MSEGEKTMAKATKTAILGSDLRVTVDGREIGRVFRAPVTGRFFATVCHDGGYAPIFSKISASYPALAARLIARKAGAELEVPR